MPMYEYQCKKCGNRFEKIEKFSDKPQTKCPKCKKGKVERLVSAPAIQFKGTGWYVTDYAGKVAPKDESPSSDSSSSETKETPKESSKEASKESSTSKEEKAENKKQSESKHTRASKDSKKPAKKK